MNILIRYFVLLKLVTELCCVNTYTVFLKPVLPLYPAIRVYKYDVRHPKIFKEPTAQYVQHTPPVSIQRIYPVYVKHQYNQNFRTVFPIKKEKIKYKIKISPTTEKVETLPKDQRLHDLQQELVPPQSNQLEEYTEANEEELEEGSGAEVSLSTPEFFRGQRFPSFGQEKGRLYNKPGEWAVREPNTESDNSTEFNFTPSQLYLQVRHKNTVIHVPQSEALKDAETLEELINAPRLKELARITHVQEMYSEEGYEDAGYDHAGHIRHAQHGEVYDAKDEGKFNIKDPPIILEYDSDREENENRHNPKFILTESDSVQENSSKKSEQNKTLKTDAGNISDVLQPPAPRFFKKEHTHTISSKQPLKIDTFIQKTFINSTDDEMKALPSTTPVYLTKRSKFPTENTTMKEPNDYLKPPPPKNISSKYRQIEMNSTKLNKVESNIAPQTSNLTNLEIPMDSQPSPSAKSLKYSRIYSKKTKHLRLEPFKTGSIYKPIPRESTYLSMPTDKPIIKGVINQRIVLPTIGYINSLTTAHFAKGNPTPSTNESKAQLTKPLNLTQALNYLRSGKKETSEDKFENVKKKSIESSGESDILVFEPKRLKGTKLNANILGKKKRDVFLTRQQSNSENDENYEGNDESDLPHDEKNKEIEEDEQKRIEEENIEKEKYEKDLKEEITDVEKEVLKETYKNLGVEDDVSQVFSELPSLSFENEEFAGSDLNSNKKDINSQKYPFYFSKNLPENSALRYMTSPFEFPKKSGHGMEFYESREKLIQCPEFHPPLDEVPAQGSEPQRGENPRLINLGEKIACLRAKYFDVDPFDSPFFKETDIEYVGKPKKLKKALMSNISKGKPESISPQSLKKHITNVRSFKPNQKIITAPYLDVSNSQLDTNYETKLSDNKKPKTSLQTGEEAILPRYKYLKKDEEEEGKKIEINPSYEIGNEPFSHKPPTLASRAPYAEAFTTTKTDNDKNLQRLSNVRIAFPRNCVPAINKMTAQEGAKNFVLDCSNSGFFERETNKSEIIPQLQLSDKIIANRAINSYQTDWVPIVGYLLPKNANNSVLFVGRKADDISNTTNGTIQNIDSDHFVIDELVEEENVRKGEVLDDMDHYYKLLNETASKVHDAVELKEDLTKIANTTREKRDVGFDATNIESSTQRSNKDLVDTSNPSETSRPFQTKRTLTRLSGKDFLNRYHSKNRKNALASNNSSNFWKISTSSPPITKSQTNINKKKVEEEKQIGESNEKKAKSLNNKGKEINQYQISDYLKTDKKVEEAQKILPKNINKSVRRLEIKQTSEFRKIPFFNFIPEKINKKHESKPNFENEKVSGQNPSLNLNSNKESKIVITKIISAVSETTEKYKMIRKKNEEITTTSTTTAKTPKNKENIERRPNETKNAFILEKPKKTGNEKTGQHTEGDDKPVLYYVVDERTGKGNWISSHSRRRKLSKNFRKRKENHKT